MVRAWWRLIVTTCILGGAKVAPGQAGVSHALTVFPAAVRLDDGRDRQRLVAYLRAGDGQCEDVTQAATWRVVPATLALIERVGDDLLVRPRRDGDGEIVGTVGDRVVAVRLQVRHAEVAPSVSFVNEVLPILTKAGCNAGSCHGAASGKNGFGLSLFAFDPARDHTTLTRDLRGRRLDVAVPDESLFLKKASARIPHQGGKRLPADGAFYGELRAWVAAGAADDRAAAPALTRIEVQPDNAVVVGSGQRLPLVLLAHYQDGSDRDVTTQALWSSSNDAAVTVDGRGHACSHDAGEANLLARYGGLAVVTQVQVHADARPFVWPGTEPRNFVDEFVFAKLRRAHVVPAESCSDEVFLRRVHLDLLGVLPTVDETLAFLEDTSDDKRGALVGRLLARPEFATVQAMAWADVLQVDGETMEKKGAALMTRYLQAAFGDHRPFDAVVRELLTAEGASFTTPAVNFYTAANQPNLMAEQAAQVFLGVRLQCAQCHNHPFENWTMDDYYGFAAYFGQVARKRAEDPTEWIVYDRRNGEVRHKLDNRVVAPKLLGAPPGKIPPGADRRAVLAEWLTASENPFFAKNLANRVWVALFGRGIVDPPDDVRVSNPPSHPDLLARLAQLLIDAKFDFRPLYRTICASHTYQAGRHADTPAAALFAGNQVRRLSAEQLLDAVAAVTGVPTLYPGLPLGSPASAIVGGKTGVRFLDVFGRPARSSACTCDRSDEPTLSQTLHLVNGDTITTKLAAKSGHLQQALARQQKPEALLDELFLRAYCRRPTPAEEDALLQRVQQATDKNSVWQDLYWAVLNSREFTFQH